MSKTIIGVMEIKLGNANNAKENNNKINNVKENKTMNTTMNNRGNNNGAAKRLEVLKKAGIDTSKYYAINDTIIEVVNGEPIEVDVETILNAIKETGDIFNPILDGRWIMGQMLKMLGTGNFNKALESKGYRYQWDMLLDENNKGEIHRLAKREAMGEDISIKSLIFNGKLIAEMIREYTDKLKHYMYSIYRIYNTQELSKFIFNGDETRLFRMMYEEGRDGRERAVGYINAVFMGYVELAEQASSYNELQAIMQSFNSVKIELPQFYAVRMSQDFKDAYKQNGVYYILNNMIRFHGFRIDGADKKGSLDILEHRIRNYKGYQNLGWLKELIKDTEFDLRKKVKEMNNNRYSF